MPPPFYLPRISANAFGLGAHADLQMILQNPNHLVDACAALADDCHDSGSLLEILQRLQRDVEAAAQGFQVVRQQRAMRPRAYASANPSFASWC